MVCTQETYWSISHKSLFKNVSFVYIFDIKILVQLIYIFIILLLLLSIDHLKFINQISYIVNETMCKQFRPKLLFE